MWKLFSPFMIGPSKGAKTSVYLATSPEVLEKNGGYFDKQKEVAPSPIAEDAALAKKLWEVSEQLIN